MRPLAPPPVPAAYDLDMTKVEDEPLVVMAQECGYRPARDELICRCLRLARQHIGNFASRYSLQEADCQDALQDAVLWILEAIERYRTSESVKPGGCRFRSFVHRVLAARLVDFFRHLRQRGHLPLPGGRVVCPAPDSHRLRDEGDPALDFPAPNPLTSMEEAEVQSRLRQELAALGAADRGLWDLLAAGTPLRQVAAARGISYDAVKRHRRKLLAHLRASLGKGYCA